MCFSWKKESLQPQNAPERPVLDQSPRNRYSITPFRALHFTRIGNSIENSGKSPGPEIPCHLEHRVENGAPNLKKFRDGCTAFKQDNFRLQEGRITKPGTHLDETVVPLLSSFIGQDRGRCGINGHLHHSKGKNGKKKINHTDDNALNSSLYEHCSSIPQSE